MIKFDPSEHIRNFIGGRIIRYKRISPVYTLAMLILANSLLIAGALENRLHPYIAITISFVTLFCILELSAWLYLDKGHLYRAEIENEMKYNPSTSYLITPYQRMLFRTIYLPYMKCISSMTDNKHPSKKVIDHAITNLEEWVNRGIIPAKHFPEKEQKYILSKKDRWFDEPSKKKSWSRN